MTHSNKPFYEAFVKKKAKTVHKATAKKNTSTARFNSNTNQQKHEKPLQVHEAFSFGTPVFSGLSSQAKRILTAFPSLLERILPLDSKKKATLPRHIQALFHELTDERGTRNKHYLNDPVKRSAYVHYYLWWNLVRITKLVQHMYFPLEEHAVAADFGSGPLTLICALWIAKPELRKKRLTWYCVDISHTVLSFGEELFLTLCAYTEQLQQNDTSPWRIKKVCGAFGTPLNEQVSLFTEANMFNEIFWNSPLPLNKQAVKTAEQIAQYVHPQGSVLLIEPGIPLAGTFISFMREQLLKKGFSIESPCPHEKSCPLPGKQQEQYTSKKPSIPTAHGKWCHFVFDTDDSPTALLHLSHAAHLGKERASLSYVYCSHKKETHHTSSPAFCAVRICSDIIMLGEHIIGRYGCCEKGFTLITSAAYRESPLNKAVSGSMLMVSQEKLLSTERDKKTGAIVIAL